jgi:7-keto-8-aminopelargonate synthetase-like enzyme
VSALSGAGERVISDALNHASLVDGCRLARAETVVFPHKDLDALATALTSRATVVTDAVFSMDGDLAPLAEIAELTQRHGARLIVDEAHATGVVGATGRGLAYELGVMPDVIVGTLGKALGSYGAFACCSAEMADFLVNRARTLIYSTALPPPSIGAAMRALDLMDRERVARLHANARTLRAALGVTQNEMPIVPLIAGEPEAALAACAAALEQGAFAQAIRPPTVPPGTSRLRLVATAAHDAQDLARAADIFRSGNMIACPPTRPSPSRPAAGSSTSCAAANAPSTTS